MYSTCIISAYFKIPNKFSHAFYQPYILQFLNNVNSTLVFFTSDDVYNELKPNLTNTDRITFVILSFDEFVSIKKHGRDFWETQYARDPERYHSPELAIVWCEKKEFVIKASKLIKSDVYIWCDAGCARQQSDIQALHQFGLRSHKNIADGTLHLWCVKPNHWFSKFYIHPVICIACGIMAGTIGAWENYVRVYDEMLKEYDTAKITCDSDQYITLSCTDKHPELFTFHDNNLGYENWVGFLYLL